MRKYIFLFLCYAAFISCKQVNSVNDNKFEINTSNIPFASVQELSDCLELDDNIVNYILMQKIALEELTENCSFFGFNVNDILSEYPVIIYDKITGLPEYYEFEVIRDGKNIGFITTVANKQIGEPIQFVSSEPNNFSKDNSRAVINGSAQIYDNDYPNIVFIKKTERIVSNKKEKTSRDIFLEYLNCYTEEELNSYGYTREEIIFEYDKALSEEKERLNKLWNAIEEEQDLILSYPNENRSIISQDDKIWRIQLLKPWVNQEYKFTNECLTLYCGPTALGIVLAGYNNTGECAPYVNALVNAGLKDDGAVYHPGMNKALKEVSNGQFRLGYHLNHFYNDIWNEVNDNKLPVISLREGNSDSAAWHYRVIIGMAQNNKSGSTKAKWYNYSTANYYYMADNGSDSSNGGNKPYDDYGTSFDYTCSGKKFWEKHRENGWYFQHFPVMED